MIGSIFGKFVEKYGNTILISVNGLGYEVVVGEDFKLSLRKGQNLFLYTQFIVRETSFTLYGFDSIQKKILFNKLLMVNGIGPKVAMDIVSQIEPDKLINYILTSDISGISKIRGLGRKSAEKIIFTLKEKFEKEKTEIKTTMPDLKANELVQALVFLGYSEMESKKVADKVYDSEKEISELIKIAIKEIKNV